MDSAEFTVMVPEVTPSLHLALLQEHPQAQAKSTREPKHRIFVNRYAESHLGWEETLFIVVLSMSLWIVLLFECTSPNILSLSISS